MVLGGKFGLLPLLSSLALQEEEELATAVSRVESSSKRVPPVELRSPVEARRRRMKEEEDTESAEPRCDPVRLGGPEPDAADRVLVARLEV
mmetsp:Transcript_30959/g.77417  ORF Transcript_30959/g.77417 Transcript_30959/m.77417 type:complete len:91 (+) Transcript_30959:622-894(+)